MKSRISEALLVIVVVLGAAALIMILVHFWHLTGLFASLQPLARGSVAFFLGGAALYAVRDFREPGAASALTRLSLRAIILVGLIGVYLIPVYCNFRHVRADLQSAPDPVARDFALHLGFMDYVHLVGTDQPILDANDLPDGDGFFDILVGMAMFIDVLIQKLFTNVLHLAVAGYVSLVFWYLMFVFFSYCGAQLFYDR